MISLIKKESSNTLTKVLLHCLELLLETTKVFFFKGYQQMVFTSMTLYFQTIKLMHIEVKILTFIILMLKTRKYFLFRISELTQMPLKKGN